MSLKKKGTPTKLEVVPDVKTLEQFKKVIEKATGPDVKKSKESKSK